MKYLGIITTAFFIISTNASVLKRDACYNVYGYSSDESWNTVCTKFNTNGEVRLGFLDNAGLGHGPSCHFAKVSYSNDSYSLKFLTKSAIFRIVPNIYQDGNEGVFTTRNSSYSYVRLDKTTEENHLNLLENMKCH